MGLIPDEWMPDCRMDRIICHWTAGGYKASALDRKHYHVLVEGDGDLIRGIHSIRDNVSTADGVYAAHTKGTNSGSIGISVCAMSGAREAPFQAGPAPMKEQQWVLLARIAAELASRYRIPVTSKTILGHGEVQKELGRKQDGKWDPMVLPWDPSVPQAEVGKRFRSRVSAFVAHPGARTLTSGTDSVGTTTVSLNGAILTDAVFSNEDVLLPAPGLAARLNWSVSPLGADRVTVVVTGRAPVELGVRRLDEDAVASGAGTPDDVYLSANDLSAALEGFLAFDIEREVVLLNWAA